MPTRKFANQKQRQSQNRAGNIYERYSRMSNSIREAGRILDDGNGLKLISEKKLDQTIKKIAEKNPHLNSGQINEIRLSLGAFARARRTLIGLQKLSPEAIFEKVFGGKLPEGVDPKKAIRIVFGKHAINIFLNLDEYDFRKHFGDFSHSAYNVQDFSAKLQKLNGVVNVYYEKRSIKSKSERTERRLTLRHETRHSFNYLARFDALNPMQKREEELDLLKTFRDELSARAVEGDNFQSNYYNGEFFSTYVKFHYALPHNAKELLIELQKKIFTLRKSLRTVSEEERTEMQKDFEETKESFSRLKANPKAEYVNYVNSEFQKRSELLKKVEPVIKAVVSALRGIKRLPSKTVLADFINMIDLTKFSKRLPKAIEAFERIKQAEEKK